MAWAWMAVAVVVAALGVDRAAGYSTDFANRIRGVAARGGWYGGRRQLQIGLSVIAVALLAATAGAMVRVRGVLRPLQNAALVAVTCLAALRVVRTISLHDVDVALRTQVAGIRVATLAEAALLAVTFVAGLTGLREKESFP